MYLVWNFLDEALKNNSLSPFAQSGYSTSTYNYGFWVDAGSFRQEHLPALARFESHRGSLRGGSILTGTPQDELIFFPMYTIPDRGWKWWRESDGPADFDFTKGSLFGGSPKAISWYTQTLYAQHDKYPAEGIFVGKDQTLINAIMFLHTNKVISIWVVQPPSYIPSPASLPSVINLPTINAKF